MRNESIKKRLAALKSQIELKTCFCLVELPDGTEKEVALDDWYKNRHEWRWLRMTGGDPRGICLLLAAIDDCVAESAMQEGDVEAAARLTAESAKFLAKYERRAAR